MLSPADRTYQELDCERNEADRSATNKPPKSHIKKLQQLKSFPSRLKPINRSPVKRKEADDGGSRGGHVDIKFDHDEAVQLLSRLKRRHSDSPLRRPTRAPVHWPFTPSEERETIRTPPLPPTPREGTACRSRSAKKPRLHFVRERALPAVEIPAPLHESRIPNSCPTAPLSFATHNIASLCGTASLRRYKMPDPPSLPSGVSTPPVLDIDREIEMWEEEERCSRGRSLTPPDKITQGMASWGDVPEKVLPHRSAAEQSAHDQPSSPVRIVLGDITSQFAHAPPPSMSGVDLTAHLMSLVESLDPVRTAPRRRRQAMSAARPQRQPTPAAGSKSSPLASRLGCGRSHTLPVPMCSKNDQSTTTTRATAPVRLQGDPSSLVCGNQPVHNSGEVEAAESCGSQSQPPVIVEAEDQESPHQTQSELSSSPPRRSRINSGDDGSGVWSGRSHKSYAYGPS